MPKEIRRTVDEHLPKWLHSRFLSAVNFAEYCAHRGAGMPVVFGVADNDASISLAGHGWLPKFIEQRLGGCKIYTCDGSDGSDVFRAAAEAFAYARSEQRPAVLVVEDLPRRFGHAATDRQEAYLSQTEIEGRRARDPLAGFIGDAVARGVLDANTVAARNDEIARAARNAFDAAAAEPKLDDRAALVKRVAAPLAPVPPTPAATTGKKDVLRKHATRVLDELLSKHEDVVYIGEDVEHGGYYLVSEGLKAKHGRRVRDFPPDETALLGAAAGLAQRGLVPLEPRRLLRLDFVDVERLSQRADAKRRGREAGDGEHLHLHRHEALRLVLGELGPIGERERQLHLVELVDGLADHVGGVVVHHQVDRAELLAELVHVEGALVQ